MPWPLAAHFSSMLQNPRIAFRDPQLRQCRIERDAMNQPRPWAGAFAVVYKAVSAESGTPVAVRVFSTESPERRERYNLIAEYLKPRKLKCLVAFEYRDESIRSAGDGKWYPMILMDWVDGETLFHWARHKCLEGNRLELRKAAQHWVALVRELAENEIAHGDLQHANVMITPAGEIKLVDYDGMCVPGLVGRRNLEVGVEPYQHPARNEHTKLSLDLDHFSSQVIYVALRALAADPALWTRYVEQPGHDKLLFRGEDFRAPGGSPLVAELRGSADHEVRDLLERLLESMALSIDRVPSLLRLADGFAKLEQMLIRKEWSAAVRWLNRRGQFRDAPGHLKPLIKEAYEHVLRKEAWDSFQKIAQEETEAADRQVVAAWIEPLFVGFGPAELQRARYLAARKRLEVLEEVGPLALQADATPSLDVERQLAHLAAQIPPGYDHAHHARTQLATRRVDALGQFSALICEPIDEPALAAAWQAVRDAQATALVDPQRLPRVELAAQRAPLVRALQEIPPQLPADQFDRRILTAWRDDLLADCPQAAPWREAYQTALRRKAVLRQLQTAVDTHNAAAVLQLAEDPILAGYPLAGPWAQVIRSARQQAARTAALAAVLQERRQADFLARFDARLIRQYAEHFRQYQQLLRQWTEREVLPIESLGLGPAVGRASLAALDEPQRAYRVRWTWPPARFSDRCVLCITSYQPGPGDDPTRIDAVHRMASDRQGWESGGGSRLLYVEPAWDGYYVSVWARIDLGFLDLYSHPLVLGRLEVRGQSLWKRLFKRAGPADASPPEAPPIITPQRDVHE